MPGPTVPRPAPTPSAIALIALAFCALEPPLLPPDGAACARKWGRTECSDIGPSLSVALGGPAAEGDRRERGEGECLKAGPEDEVEGEEPDPHQRGGGADPCAAGAHY